MEMKLEKLLQINQKMKQETLNLQFKYCLFWHWIRDSNFHETLRFALGLRAIPWRTSESEKIQISANSIVAYNQGLLHHVTWYHANLMCTLLDNLAWIFAKIKWIFQETLVEFELI